MIEILVLKEKNQFFEFIRVESYECYYESIY